jgi:hypothetical protein
MHCDRRVVARRQWDSIARVQPHPNPDLAVGRPRVLHKGPLSVRASHHGVSGALKRHEHAITLDPNFHTPVSLERAAQELSVIFLQGVVALRSQGMEKACRAFNIRETKRDRSGRKTPRRARRGPHQSGIVAQDRAFKRSHIRTRLNPEVLAEIRPKLLKSSERLRLASAAIQRQHPPGPEALAQWISPY